MSEIEGPRIVLVAALARDRTIGKGGDIPWRYPEDWRNFKRVTMGTLLVMGRKTYDSIGRPLPGRVTVVLTRSPEAFSERVPEVPAVRSFEEAIEVARQRGIEVVSVLGGAEIYALALRVGHEMLLSYVPEDGGGDTFFPEWDDAAWEEASRETLERVEVVRYLRVTR